MAGAGVPVPSVDDDAIAAALHAVCAPLPEWPRRGQKWRVFFAGDPPCPICPNWLGVGNAVLRRVAPSLGAAACPFQASGVAFG